LAVEFRPFAEAQVTVEQWQDYYDQVEQSLGGTERRFPELKLMTYDDLSARAAYAFTQPGHPAHPAWISRRVVEKDGWIAIEQVGYFAGAEDPFAELFREYKSLNDSIRRDATSEDP
jgi:hypothetical protein